MASALLRSFHNFSSNVRSMQCLAPGGGGILARTFSSIKWSANGEYRTANIQAKEPDHPIVSQLYLFIKQNPNESGIHGLWMGFEDDKGLVSLINDRKRNQDYVCGRRDWNTLSDDQKSQLMEIWKNDDLKRPKDFRNAEFAKHAFTSYECYKQNYFRDALDCARPYMDGGSKELGSFIKEKFEVGKSYPIMEVQEIFSNFVSYKVRVDHDGHHAIGLVIAFLEDRSKGERPLLLINHPQVTYSVKNIVVRAPPTKIL